MTKEIKWRKEKSAQQIICQLKMEKLAEIVLQLIM